MGKKKSKFNSGLDKALADLDNLIGDAMGGVPVPKGVDEATLEVIWGKRRLRRLNEIIDTEYYGPLTVRELAALVLCDKKNYPKGLDTPISTGDVEGNSSQHKYSVMTGGMKSDHVCLSYEMHEFELF